MKSMNQKAYKTLEFDKILNKITNYSVLDVTKDSILSLTPKTDIENARLVLSETEETMNLIIKSGSPPLLNFGELDSIIKRLEVGGGLSARELLRVATLLSSSRQMRDYFSRSEKGEFLEYRNILIQNKRLEDEITTRIISDDEIADSASDELYKIRRQKASSSAKIRETLQKYISSPSYKKFLQNASVTIRNERFVLPVKQEFKNEIQGLIHDSSDSGATVFVEPMSIVTLNNSLKELEAKEREEIEKILFYLSGLASGVSSEIETSSRILINLDLIFSKAKYSLSIKGEIPSLNDDGIINLKKARHPLLDPQKAVPVDISLGGECDTLVITGPNTGGKTVSLKTIGLLTLMAQSGIAIPTFMGSQTAVFKKLYADIGDEQSIEQSLSTFSSHMKNIVSIIEDLSDDSLVLFDELGAGTDPTEGAALAIALIEYLRARGAKIAATTHYPEIKLYALSESGVQNASLEFSVETLMPTYKLIMGIPGKSNAFAISKKLGLNDEILKNAESKLSSDALKFEDVLTVIDEQRVMAEREKEDAERLKIKISELQNELNSKKEDALVKSRAIIENAQREALNIINAAKEKCDDIIENLNNSAKEQKERAKAIGDARRKIGEERKIQEEKLQNTPQNQKNPLTLKEIKIGMSVKMDNFENAVTVETMPDSKGNLTVLAGIMKVKTNISRLSKAENSQQERLVSAYRNINMKDRQIKAELDLRGMNLDEAEFTCEKFIDDAILGKIQTITIIHGKGTGVLRAGISQLLKKNKAVKSFRPGVFGEGEAGVTIAELK